MDTSVRPQDDFYRYANGTWLASAEIPADQVGWGSYMTLRDEGLAKLRDIVEELGDTGADETAAKISNYYKAYMNEQRVDSLGMTPLDPLFSEIDAIKDHDAMAAWFGEANRISIDGPFGV